MRIVALLATFNERRFVGPCIEHLAAHGVEVYLLENESTDGTPAIAERYLGRGLAGMETFPRTGVYPWRPLLERKAELAASLDADWFLHVDADELRLPPASSTTLAEALREVDARGYNAVNFLEYTFVPTREAPDHDHPRFQETMRSYYPFLPAFPHRLNAWKRQDEAVDLTQSGGHRVSFPGLRMYPTSFPMRHYLFLGVEHAVEKYVLRGYDEAELALGWHGGRASLRAEDISLLGQEELRTYVSDELLDPSEPRASHPLFAGSPAARERA